MARSEARDTTERDRDDSAALHYESLADRRTNDDAAWGSLGHIDHARQQVTQAYDSPEPDHRTRIEADETNYPAIRSYTGNDYDRVNRSLWKGSLDDVKDIAPYSHDLSAELATLPDFVGTVYRGSSPGRRADDYNLARYEPGQVVTENGYTSCSQDPEAEFGGPVLWIIESKHGKSIEGSSLVQSEREVLMDRMAQFRVLSKDYDAGIDDGGRWMIYMEEV